MGAARRLLALGEAWNQHPTDASARAWHFIRHQHDPPLDADDYRAEFPGLAAALDAIGDDDALAVALAALNAADQRGIAAVLAVVVRSRHASTP